MLNRGVESRKFPQQEAGLSSTSASSSNLGGMQKQQQYQFQQGNMYSQQISNSMSRLGSNTNYNPNNNINSASKMSGYFTNGFNGQNAKSYINTIAQAEFNNKNYTHNNRKLVSGANVGGSGGGGGSQYNSNSTQTTMNTAGGGGYLTTQQGTEINGIQSTPIINNSVLNNNIPLQYQSNKNSQILRMGENMEYLLGKGYMKDACDSFLDYVYQVQDLPFHQLLCDEYCEGSEEIQLKESALLYKLSTKFSSYLMQTAPQNQNLNGSGNVAAGNLDGGALNQSQQDLDNSFVIMQFIQKVLQSAQNKHDESVVIKWKANYFSNLGIYFIRKHEYMLALNYFQLSLQQFQILQVIFQQKIEEQTQASNQVPSQATAFFANENQNNKQNANNNNNNNNNQAGSTSDNFEIEEDLQNDEQMNRQNMQQQQQSARQTSQQQNQITEGTPEIPQTLLNEMSGWTTQQSIVLNNLAVLYGIMDDLDKAEQLLIQSVSQSESEVFQAMRTISTQYLRKDKQFLEKLPVLIYGYIFYEGVRKKKLIRHEQPILQVNDPFTQTPKSFLKNAYSLCKKFFGEDNPFTHKIDIFRRRFSLHNQHADILAETFPFDIDTQKLKFIQMYTQHQNQESVYLNLMLGTDIQGLNEYQQGLNKQNPYMYQKKNSDLGNIEDLFDEKQQDNQQVDPSNGSVKRIRNKSMYQLTAPNNQNKSFGFQSRPFPLSPHLKAYQIQQQQQLVSRNKSIRSQHQFRISTQANELNFKNSKGASISISRSINQTQQDEGQRQIQQELRNLQQSLASVESQLKSMKNTGRVVNKQNSEENQDLNKYKKDIKQQQQRSSSQNTNNPLKEGKSEENVSANSNKNNKFNDNNDDQPTQMQYSINNNNAYAVNSGVSRTQQRSQSNFSSNNSIRDERSNSNGSIKPSQFKKEQNKQQEKMQQNNTQQEQGNTNIIGTMKQKIMKKESQELDESSKLPEQPKKEVKNPFINQMYSSENQKANSSQQNNTNRQQAAQPQIQQNTTMTSSITIANPQLNTQSFQYGGGSFSQAPALNSSVKSEQKQDDKQNLRESITKKQATAAQNGNPEAKQLSMSTSQNQNEAQKMQISPIHHERRDQLFMKKKSEEKEAPKLASMLQQQQNYQISKITETIVKNLQVDQIFVLKKRIHLKDSNESYVVKCGVLYNKQEKGYKIAISSQIGQNTQSVKVEEIELSILTNLLCFVSFQDVLPSTMNLDSINSLYDVCKYFILPFVGLQNKQPERLPNSSTNNPPLTPPSQPANPASELENKVIMVNPRANGILSEYYKTQFLEQNVLVQFNYIEGFQFRVVICDKETNKKNLRIDVEYDEGSFNALYTTSEQDEYHAQKLKDFFECTEESEISKQGVELVHREVLAEGLKKVQERKQTNSREEYFIQSVKIQNQQNFTSHFTNIITDFERIIKQFSTHPNLESVSRDLSSFRVRVYQGLKKSLTIITTDSKNQYYPPLTQQAAINNPKHEGVRSILFNNFESYGAQGTKLKEKGEQILTVKEIKKIYGLNYPSLGAEQKQILYTLCSYNFNLRVIEKISDSMQKMKPKGEENNILRVQSVSGGESTMLIQGLDNYQYPIIFEIFGSKDIFLGIKITLYNPVISEEQGIFLTTNHNSWLFNNEALKKKLHHFIVDSLPLSNYFITHIFKKIAVPILFQNLYIENINPSIQKQGSLSNFSSVISTPFGGAKKANQEGSFCKNPPKLLGTKGLITDNCIILRLETLLDSNSTINYFLPQKQR